MYFESLRWNGCPVCPYCGSDKYYKLKDGRRYKCGNKECFKIYTVTVGTIFESSHIPLNIWFAAAYLIASHKKGISSYQLAKDLSVTQKTAWFMGHRLREMMRAKEAVRLNNTVEVDEVYMGGKVGNMSKKKRTFLRENNLTLKTKTAVMGMVERGGELRLITVGKEATTNKIIPTMFANISTTANLITDNSGIYNGMNKVFTTHEVVNHKEQEFVRDNTHTNTIEGAFSLLKRSIYGIYHQVTPKHLNRYCDETAFRYNLRKMKDYERFNLSLTKMEGRLSYKNLVLTPKEETLTQTIRKGFKIPVLAIRNGEVVARYESIKEAARMTGVDETNIHRVLKGKRYTSGGFEWRYE
jgi:transposase-like protein